MYTWGAKREKERKEKSAERSTILQGAFLAEEKMALEITGFEPVASRMQSERSTTELYPRPLQCM